MRAKNLHLLKRNRDVLLHIWKWKLATPASLHNIFFKDYHFQNCFYHIRKLKKKGFVRAEYDISGQSIAWTLTRKGFSAIKLYLPPLKESGYKSDCPDHDILLSSVQYEGFLNSSLNFLSVITEQELRRYEQSGLPKWVPRLQFRRPDGYWRVYDKKRDLEDVIALEVELSRKTDDDYESISNVYAATKSVRRIIWLVPNMTQVKRLNCILNVNQKKSYNKHNIIIIEDYYKNLWGANISAGPDKGKPMGRLLGFVPVETFLPAKYSPMLDGRKYPVKSEGYKVFGIG